MTLWLLVTAVVAGLASTVLPRLPAHRFLGGLSWAALVVALVALPSADGEEWLVMVALFAAVGVNAFGVLMLLARRHPRRRHRHIVYCGYGVVLAVIALCWELASRHPGAHHDLWATVASVAAYAIGSLGIAWYKSWQTRDLPADREPRQR